MTALAIKLLEGLIMDCGSNEVMVVMVMMPSERLMGLGPWM